MNCVNNKLTIVCLCVYIIYVILCHKQNIMNYQETVAHKLKVKHLQLGIVKADNEQEIYNAARALVEYLDTQFCLNYTISDWKQDDYNTMRDEDIIDNKPF